MSNGIAPLKMFRLRQYWSSGNNIGAPLPSGSLMVMSPTRKTFCAGEASCAPRRAGSPAASPRVKAVAADLLLCRFEDREDIRTGWEIPERVELKDGPQWRMGGGWGLRLGARRAGHTKGRPPEDLY